MDNDDVLVGRLLTRRELLVLMGGASLALVAGCSDDNAATSTPTRAVTQAASAGATRTPSAAAATSSAVPSCVVRPGLTEGPYFVDEKLERSDIRSDPSDGTVKDGLPLSITFLVSTVASGGCTSFAGATVDVWHCDAQGVYSDVQDPGFSTKGKKFLRGFQLTDSDGKAQFTTIYPGWYQGRTVHIHFKIRTAGGSGSFEFTSQFFMDDAITDTVHAKPPYAAKGVRTLRNDGDMIFRQSGGQLTLDLAQTADGYAATFDIGLDMA